MQPAATGPKCGDDKLDPGEACERNVAMPPGVNCASMRPGSTGFLNCTTDCKFDFQMCVMTATGTGGTGSGTGGTGSKGTGGTGTR
jgi:hypothetical protein